MALPDDLVSPDRVYPPRDPRGAVVPHRMTLPTWLAAVPSLLLFFDGRVPEQFLAETVDDDGEFQIVIACPCGSEPTIGFGKMAECSCGRFFLHDGKEIRVGREET